MDHDRTVNTAGVCSAFFAGLFTGAAVGTAIALWFAPRSGAQMRKRVARSARAAGDAFTGAMDELTERGQAVYDRATEVAAQTGEGVERVANAIGEAATDSARTIRRAARRG